MTTQLTPLEIAGALQLRDLSDPTDGPHAMQILLRSAVDALAARWGCAVALQRPRPVVAVEDNYDRLGYDRADITRDSRYSRYLSPTVMLRSHTSAGVPPALRALAADPDAPGDVLLALPGLVHRRDAIDRLHVGTPHQLDLWRVVRGAPVAVTDLMEMIETLVEALLPGASWRAEPARHPYTRSGYQIDVQDGGAWVELAECGLIAPDVLAAAGLDPRRHSGLALGMGLDRALMLRKGVPDIRLLRATDPRVAEQMLDLAPWRPVSAMPAVRRDLSVVIGAGIDAGIDAVDDELIGDRARAALGPDADLLESVAVRAVTPHEQLPDHVRERLRTRPGQSNALVRIVLRPIDRTLTDAEANEARDRVYAALHEGDVAEWTAR